MSIAVLFLGLYLNFSKVQHGTEQGGRVDNYQREEQVELDQMYVLKLGGGARICISRILWILPCMRGYAGGRGELDTTLAIMKSYSRVLLRRYINLLK
jgi:hypothetical protein